MYNITDQITKMMVKHSWHCGIDHCLMDIVYLWMKWNSYPWRTIPRGDWYVGRTSCHFINTRAPPPQTFQARRTGKEVKNAHEKIIAYPEIQSRVVYDRQVRCCFSSIETCKDHLWSKGHGKNKEKQLKRGIIGIPVNGQNEIRKKKNIKQIS